MTTNAYEFAVDHAMLYEVGGHWRLTPEVEAGLIGTQQQRRNVGYVNDPLDPGGETKFGVAKNANPDLDITNLDWQGAKSVYYNRYWIPGSCGQLPPRIAVLHFDGCVNHGIGRANKFLQGSVGATQDGVVGPQTLNAIFNSDEFAICNAICDLRAQFYQSIVDRKPDQARFLGGWLRRVEEMRVFCCDPDQDFS